MPAQAKSRPRVVGLTIDGVSSQDLDDAIWVQPQADGILCQVHITDVDAAVPQGSAVDQQSAQRLETQYRAAYNLPMLPRQLAEQQCSLLPGDARPTITVSWTLARDGEIATSPHLFLSQFESKARWTYPDFDQALKEGNAQCQLLQLVAEHLYRLRGGEQAALGRTWEGVGYVSEEGQFIQKPFHSQMIVAEFAILANCFVAEFAQRQQLPLLFRNQRATSEQLASPLVQQLLAIGEPSELRRCLSQSLEPAEYNLECRGHFGLGLDAYCHFTSPIRRYVDLLNHRLVKAHLLNREIPYSPEELQTQAERSTTWQRSIRLERHQYFKAKAQAQTEQQLTDPRALAQLSAKEFSRAVIAACKTHQLEQLQEELLHRSQTDTLRLVDLRWILMRGEMPSLQIRLLEQLSPTDAISLVSMKQGDEGIESVRWEFQSAGTQWIALAIGTVQGQEATCDYIQASSKQEAKGQAAKALLAGWIHQSLIPLDEREPWQPETTCEEVEIKTPTSDRPTPTPEPSALQPDDSLQNDSSQNDIGALNNLAQKQGGPMPIYEIVAQEPSGFCATVQWQEWTYSAEGSSKKRAKAAAAQLLWQALQQEKSGPSV